MKKTEEGLLFEALIYKTFVYLLQNKRLKPKALKMWLQVHGFN